MKLHFATCNLYIYYTSVETGGEELVLCCFLELIGLDVIIVTFERIPEHGFKITT